jgi:guanylate kinase
MNKRVIIVGKGGSGKDHLRKSLSEIGYNYCVSHTSRPPRQDEENGIISMNGLLSMDGFMEHLFQSLEQVTY